MLGSLHQSSDFSKGPTTLDVGVAAVRHESRAHAENEQGDKNVVPHLFLASFDSRAVHPCLQGLGSQVESTTASRAGPNPSSMYMLRAIIHTLAFLHEMVVVSDP
jgi:hypothetical protein